MTGRWIWVSLPPGRRGSGYMCGIVVNGGRVVDAAPIARWTIGKDERVVADWFRLHDAEIVPLSN